MPVPRLHPAAYTKTRDRSERLYCRGDFVFRPVSKFRGQAMGNRRNPHCPVIGCRTTAPHIDDPTVKALMIAFAPPAEMTEWTLAAMAELSQSICRDLENKKVFAFHTRIRQPEELYIRT